MRPLGLPRWLRLRSRREFLRAQRRGEKHHTRHFLVFITPRANKRKRQHESRSAGSALVSSPVSQGSTREVTPEDRRAALQPTRLGVTVTRKVGRAHQRNRIKRLVREVFRQERARLVPGFDMVWVAKRNALSFSLEELRADFIALADRLERRASKRASTKRGAEAKAKPDVEPNEGAPQ